MVYYYNSMLNYEIGVETNEKLYVYVIKKTEQFTSVTRMEKNRWCDSI